MESVSLFASEKGVTCVDWQEFYECKGLSRTDTCAVRTAALVPIVISVRVAVLGLRLGL